MYRKPGKRTATILSGATESDIVRLGAYGLVGLILPATFTGATITFKACATPDGTFRDVYDTEGNQVSITVTQGRAYGLSASDADALAAFNFIKLVSGSAELAERAIDVTLK